MPFLFLGASVKDKAISSLSLPQTTQQNLTFPTDVANFPSKGIRSLCGLGKKGGSFYWDLDEKCFMINSVFPQKKKKSPDLLFWVEFNMKVDSIKAASG